MMTLLIKFYEKLI